MRQIDENLRRVYRQDEEADVPDRFQKLLQQLKEREAKGEAEDREQDSADE
ncbi:regulator [Maribius pontilimi]|uniref:Regulator n=2 Tax=Palleronia pontilimi TaxID=1964209 RepID=A0A934I7E1_9RHOB|nr:regulator [Palleronia pontilimi]